MHNLDSALRPWTRRAASLVADARAHAGAGSIADAHARLDELRDGLIGRVQTDPAGLVRDARAAFYRAAWAGQGPLDPEIHQVEQSPPLGEGGQWGGRFLGPSDADETWARTTPHFAEPEWRQLGAILQEARGQLAQAAGADDRAAVLAGWETRHAERITTWARMTLSDSQITLHHVVGRLMVKPSLR